MNSIFVQIASYRDPQLIPTLADMLANAKNPENLHIAICWQHGPEEGLDDFLDAGFDFSGFDEATLYKGHPRVNASYKGAKLTIIDVPHFESQGACWARNAIQQVYNGEKYTLQLDSHHRFVPEWDVKCIDMLESLRYKSPKPLLTAYISSFDPDNDPALREKTPWKMDFDRFIPEGAVFFRPSTIDDYKSRTEPMLSRYYSAHFAFADGSFAVEVQHDPEYFFHGEEISIAARAYTHGYDLYHPHIIVAWHEYTRKGRTKVWDDHTTDKKVTGKVKLDWVERNDHCHRRNRILFGMDGEDPTSVDFGKYGFGTERTLRQYEEYAGMSFEHRAVTQDVLDRKEPTLVAPKYASEQEWRDALTGSHDVHICVHKNDFGDLPDDVNFACVAIKDDEGEIHRKDLTAAEFKEYMANGWIDYRYIFVGNRKPKTYTVWPHSESQKWLTQVDRTI